MTGTRRPLGRRSGSIRRAASLVAALCAPPLVVGCTPAVETLALDAGENLVKNGGFEEGGAPVPSGWSRQPKTAAKGTAEIVEGGGTGRYRLRLAPNAANTRPEIQDDPLHLGQGFPPAGLRGRTLYVSALLSAEGGATAVVGVYAILKGGGGASVELKRDSAQPGSERLQDSLVVPDNPDLAFVVIACIARGTTGAAYFDDVSLGTRPPVAPRADDDSGGGSLAAEVEVDAGKELRPVPPGLFGANVEWIWDGNGLWNRERSALRPELVALTREARISLVRYPGGIFSDFYHWKDGVGPLAGRPETAHMPEGPKSRHLFGTDEALSFAEQVGARLFITVNAATGTPAEAAEWVRYVNGEGGNHRRVDYWEVGNEIYVRDGSAQARAATMPPAVYARRFLEFARAMRAVDPGIKVGAIGEEAYGHRAPRGYPGWTRDVLAAAGREMDFLAVHDAYAPFLVGDAGDARVVYDALLAAPLLIRDNLEDLAKRIESEAGDAQGRIRVAVTEWGPLFQVGPQGRYVDHVKTLGSALFVASTLKAFLESPRTDVAHFFQLVDALYMGWIGLRKGEYVKKAPLLAFEMYTRHFGTRLVASKTTSPTFASTSVGLVDAVSRVPYLEAVASRSEDPSKLFLIVINKHPSRPIAARIRVAGFSPAPAATAVVLTGTSLDANTGTELYQAPGVRWDRQAEVGSRPRFARGGPDEITLSSGPVAGVGPAFEHAFPPLSIVSLELAAAGPARRP
jgi:alpha-L-arabinofuranosidase